MDYPYENLLPERFQQLCQALLVSEYQGITCYPVGMPDGGRDGLRRSALEADGNFTVFQVKFAKDLIENDREWVLKAAGGEIEKVKRLKVRGANRYVFITNVKGTSHLDGGSMDRLQNELMTLLDIEVHCWWRDDISRRLDNHWDIKLRYPEILNGQDYLRLLIEHRPDSDHRRRLNAVKAFIAHQYDEDQEVKFKQVELQNRLLDLFVDLPLEINNGVFEALRLRGETVLSIDSDKRDFYEFLENIRQNDSEELGTASMLLAQGGGALTNQIVVEGAPGQGKSTLAQYLCQVHRIRLLNKSDDLGRLPLNHKNSPVLMPIKIDLRDLSEWLSGNDPFLANNPRNLESVDRSVEGFLSRLINLKTGGIAFDVNDLIEVASQTPLFLAFDGLDEVADIKRRSDVISGISKALTRLRENCPNLRCMITSRPAAFANSPGFDPKLFPYFQLGSVTLVQIKTYADSWMNARSIKAGERAEFESILNEKLDQPHLRDLSRNPMQLTILLSLIHTQGAALPDKRTSLYDLYVSLFFGRESTKNSFVRQHLDLLKDIHRYLAWILHSRAEAAVGVGTAGRFTSQELKKVLKHYLISEGQSTIVIDEVFNAMLERVVMIVSRIEGTHEFEVQPLREYFAARYLYDTASYSPPGNERSGTKPDRFDAIARNHHWLNVARFFCGCFTKGELLDLADRVKELLVDPVLGKTRYPYRFTAMLLTDSVFSQAPKASKELIDCILSKTGVRYLINSETAYHSEETVRIQGPSNEVLDKVFPYLLSPDTRSDLLHSLAELIQTNCPKTSIMQKWLDAEPTSQNDFLRWISVGFALDTLNKSSREKIDTLLNKFTLDDQSFNIMWIAGHGHAAGDKYPELLKACILSNSAYWGNESTAAYPFYLIPLFQQFPMHERYSHGGRTAMAEEINAALAAFANDQGVAPVSSASMMELSAACYSISKLVAADFKIIEDDNDLKRFFHVATNACYRAFGFSILGISMALAWVRLKPVITKFDGKPALNDLSVGIIERIAYAKRNRRQWRFWQQNLASIETPTQRIEFHSTFWSLAPANVALENQEALELDLEKLTLAEYGILLQSIYDHGLSVVSTSKNKKPETKLTFRTKRFGYLLRFSDPETYTQPVFEKYFQTTDPEEHRILDRFKAFQAIINADNSVISWEKALDILKATKATSLYIRPDVKMPDEIVKTILSQPNDYPSAIWDHAQNIFSTLNSNNIKAVATIASEEQWFPPAEEC